MKKIICISFLSIALLAGITSCGGSGIPSGKKDYIGNWEAQEMMLHISDKGKVEYERISDNGGKTSISAPIQEFKGDDFVVGALGMTTTFDVTETPHQEDGVWIMTVDGVELTRQ